LSGFAALRARRRSLEALPITHAARSAFTQREVDRRLRVFSVVLVVLELDPENTITGPSAVLVK
jgi:hypothetical protein